MKRLLYFISLLFFLYTAHAQTMQPRYAGTAKWLPVNKNVLPEKLAVTEHSFRFTKISLPKNERPVAKRKIDPHTRVIKYGATKPLLQQVSFYPTWLSAPQMVTAAPLQVRDNAVFNVVYTNRQHGFPADRTSDFAEDDEHNIWIAADAKLIRYDGAHYFMYSKANGLPDMKIVSIHIDQQKRLWIASENGVYFIRKDSIYSIRTKQLDFSTFNCNKIATDKAGNIWLPTKANGAVTVEKDGVRAYDTTCGLPVNNIQTITVAKNGDLYMGLREGMIIIGGDRITALFTNVPYMKQRIITRVHEDEGGIWIGGFSSGLIHFTKTDTTQYSFSGNYDDRIYDIQHAPGGLWFTIYGNGLCYFNENKFLEINASSGLAASSSVFFMKDSFGNIWVSDLYRGFSRLNENNFYEQPYPYKGLGNIENILSDQKNGKWIFTQTPGILYEKDHSLTLYEYMAPDGVRPLNFPMDGVLNDDGSLWTGSYGAGIAHVNDVNVTMYEYGSFSENLVVLHVKKDNTGVPWFHTINFGLINYHDNSFYHYSDKTGLINNTPLGLFADREKRLYPTFSAGIQRISNSLIETLKIGDSLYKKQVNYFFTSKQGTDFIGTENDGVYILQKDKAYQITQENGLLSNQVSSITQDSLGRIWISSAKGMEYFAMEGITIKAHKHFGQSNGSYIINAGNMHLNEKGLPFWDMGRKKLVYDPVFETAENKAPVFSIRDILVDEKRVCAGSSVSILPDQKIKIDFTCIYWGHENNLPLQCLLISRKGDTSIHFTENRNSVELSGIIPGTYKILFKAEDNAETFYSAPLALTIRNFWYNTLLFRLALVGVLVLAIIFYFKQKSRRQKAINELLTVKVKEQTKELREEKDALVESYTIIDQQVKEKDVLIQEINHRVKNNLQFIATILNMQIRSDKKKDATESLLETSRRLTAMSLVHELLYDDNMIKGLSIKKYIFELVDNLKEMTVDNTNPVLFSIDVDDILINSKSAIAMGVIISELVSNSLKHAFKEINNPEITIQLSGLEEYGKIRLVISDNGTGFARGSEQSNGLGMRLVDIFSRQLEGEYSISYSNHFQYTLECKCI